MNRVFPDSAEFKKRVKQLMLTLTFYFSCVQGWIQFDADFSWILAILWAILPLEVWLNWKIERLVCYEVDYSFLKVCVLYKGVSKGFFAKVGKFWWKFCFKAFFETNALLSKNSGRLARFYGTIVVMGR